MTTTPSQTEHADGLACYKCQYDLRGYARSEACPECGADVSMSIERRHDEAETLKSARQAVVIHMAFTVIVVVSQIMARVVLTFAPSWINMQHHGVAYHFLRMLALTLVFLPALGLLALFLPIISNAATALNLRQHKLAALALLPIVVIPLAWWLAYELARSLIH